MLDFSPLERDVMHTLLSGHHPVLRVLRTQLDALRLVRREMTGVGFFLTLQVRNGIERASVRPRCVLADVEAEIEGLHYGAGFALFVLNGLLNTLEGFTYDEPWPEPVGRYRLKFLSENRNVDETLGLP